MLFTSIPFLIFLTLTAILYFAVPGRFQWMVLLAGSVFFYFQLLPWYLLLFAVLILMNYVLAIRIEQATINRKKIYIAGIIANILVLVLFKYSGFFKTELLPDLPENSIINKIMLPIGLSYFIFTILAYLIEVKRGTVKSERHFGIFATSMLFFPKILQGPIEKPQTLLPQFHKTYTFDYDRVVDGLKLMLWGYFMKLVVADRLAIYVNAVYGNSEHHNGATLAIATVFYAFQIYADFAGYTNIALGTAKIFGYHLTNNFRRPYFATSIKDFWNRWHISFSVWLRDYLFLPLAYYFSAKLKKERYFGAFTENWIYFFATMITFSICGLWHGEGLNFLLWGALFGVYLSYAKFMAPIHKKARQWAGIKKKSVFYNVYAILATFMLVSLAWIFFRASDFGQALHILTKIIVEPGMPFTGTPAIFIYSVFAMVILWFVDFRDEFYPAKIRLFYHSNWIIRHLSYTSVIILILLFGVLDGGQFIYFQF